MPDKPRPEVPLEAYAEPLKVPMLGQWTGEQLRAILDSPRVLLPPNQRPPPSRVLLLHAYEATHGTGCPLAKARVGAYSNGERDVLTLELYRKLTGDTYTCDELLTKEARICLVRKGKGARWLAEFPTGVPATYKKFSLRFKAEVRNRPRAASS